MEVLFVFLVFVFFVWCFVRVALQPLSGPGAKVKGASTFFVSDLIWLILLLQIPLAGLSIFARGARSSIPAVLAFVAIGIFTGLWWVTVRMLSGLGVTRALRRGVCLAVILPLTLLGAISTGILSMTSIVVMLEEAPIPYRFLVPIGFVIVLAMAYPLRLLTIWVVRPRETPEAAQQETVADETGDRPTM